MQPKEDRLISVKQVSVLLGIGSSTVWRWVQIGMLPRPLKLSERTTRWRLSDIENVIEEKMRR